MHISKCVDDYNTILNLEPYSLVMSCLHRLVLLHHEMVGYWIFLFAKILIYLAFQYFDIKRIWWGLPLKCVVCTKLDIYVFISNNLTTRCVIEYDTKYCILLYQMISALHSLQQRCSPRFIRVITKLPNTQQSYKGKVKTHVRDGILLTFGNHFHYSIISLRREIWIQCLYKSRKVNGHV
jgi:hypothetical protein